jgi:hypothetical protein
MKAATRVPTPAEIGRSVHTGLTIDDVDTITACQGRILDNIILVRAHLNLDASEAMEEFEAFENLRGALYDVATRIMEDASLIHATMELAEQRSNGGAQ